MTHLIINLIDNSAKLATEAEAKHYGRWPVGKEHYSKLEIPRHLIPINNYTVHDYVAFITHRINILADRNPEVLDVEEKPYLAPHLCKGNLDTKCPACDGKFIERYFVKLEIDDISGEYILRPLKAKIYRRKRWQTEHKAKLIQKKWNKRAESAEAYQPRRTIEYYSFSKVQFRIFRDMIRRIR